jgi:hypothetical protein
MGKSWEIHEKIHDKIRGKIMGKSWENSWDNSWENSCNIWETSLDMKVYSWENHRTMAGGLSIVNIGVPQIYPLVMSK